MTDFKSRSDRWFFSGMGTLLAAMIFAGFVPTFFARDAGLPPLSAAQRLHGLTGTAWLALFVVQAWLAARRTVVRAPISGLTSHEVVSECIRPPKRDEAS